jgi:hypothetical protein
MTTELTTQPHPGYAGVTVWIGDKSITRYVPEEAFEKLYMDPLAPAFADANEELRMARWHDKSPAARQCCPRPAKVAMCLPVVEPALSAQEAEE